MESDDFIGLEPSPTSENNDKGHGVEGDDANVLDMDIEEDIAPQPSILYERAELFGHTTIEQLKARSNKDMDSGSDAKIYSATSNNIANNECSITGMQRAQHAHIEKQPCVRVIFNSLTRESKGKLMELMKQWSQWQAENQLSSSATGDAILENGEDTYFPAVYVGSKKLNAVTFWIDNKARQEVDKKKAIFEAEVPFYDRVYTLGSNTVDGSNDGGIETLEASRCFNCGSYSHSLKECPKPRDHIAIITARKMYTSSRRNPIDRAQARYHQKIPGKFDDLRAGVLGPETRECLGIGEYDPPPWFHRMREIGYPPGYLDDDDENQPSGITIFDDEETKEKYEDGELPEEGELPERSEPEPPPKKMSVAFPGINAPIPDNADPKLWAAPPTGSGSNSSRSRVHRSSHSNHHEQRWSSDARDDSMLNLDHRLPTSHRSYSPRYSPFDHNSRRRSPKSGRSVSERGWRSPSSHENSTANAPHSPPHPYPSTLQSPRDHH